MNVMTVNVVDVNQKKHRVREGKGFRSIFPFNSLQAPTIIVIACGHITLFTRSFFSFFIFRGEHDIKSLSLPIPFITSPNKKPVGIF